MADLCDMSYTLLADRIERRVLADRQTVGIAIALGANVTELPDVDAELNRFDRWLASPLEKPKHSAVSDDLMKALFGENYRR